MVARTAKPAEVPAEVPADQALDMTETPTEVSAPEDPFADLGDAEDVVYTRNGGAPITFDPNTISLRVRTDLEASYNAGYEERKNDKGETIPPLNQNVWKTQKFPSSKMLLAYIDQAKKYCAYKDWTFRKVAMDTEKATDYANAKILRFVAKPSERKTVAK